ncbi:MAG: RNA 2',3'-cyclic phosphodiesterase [Candidatus Thorarchaeota archaeon]|nr:RNA 2',3'-cyclic phosphodiesterase [Candidatus Thorarchaeota archaeon]
MTDTVRVFLSVDIEDEGHLSRIAYLQNKLDRDAAKMKLVEPENIHFTWRFFGDTPISKVESIRNELEQIRFSPFTIRIGGVGAFPSIRRPRVIWIGVTHNADAMRELKTMTDEKLGNLGYPLERREFTPHATIARVRTVRNRDAILRNLESLSHESVGTMVVNAIRMTKSILTPSGPIYEMLWEIRAIKE